MQEIMFIEEIQKKVEIERYSLEYLRPKSHIFIFRALFELQEIMNLHLKMSQKAELA